MALAPVEIRHVRLKRGLRGYRKTTVDELLADIVESFEDVWRERADLVEKVEALEADLLRHRELEALLRTTLVSAERAAEELKEQARREVKLLLDEAHAEARAIKREATAERERLRLESHRVRAQLQSALGLLEEGAQPEPGRLSGAEAA